ncbi:substrate binding domain-containing protein, partial [Pseudomonas sp. 32_A]|uniref:substrate binding domain-containing protein n=1 Tax=Pseudomonas sp. 32_A TaxID=2813559 RepID=UPI001A9DC96B
TTLLHRTTRRLSLTAAGAALLPEAQALNAQAARARQAVLALQDEARGTVRLSLPVSLGETFFDAWLMEFSREYPDIRLELDLSNALRDLVADGFDLSSRSGSLAVDERVVARPLFALQERTCATPDYLARHGVPQSPAELAGHSCLQNTHYQDSGTWLYQRH